MNAQFSPLKKFAILISLCGIFGASSLTAQSILIDSIFTTDGEIFPFSPLDTAYGLSISGRVVLNSDTSLVRVILTSDSVEQLMVYEAYPYIVSEWDNFIVRQCDETMYLDTLMPNSIQLQLVNATFELDTILIKDEMPANPKTLQEQHKALVENAKVIAIQNIIQLNDMLWFAERNPLSDLSYSDKIGLFGDKYNMCGMDYYVGGVYDPIPGVDSPPDESPLVDNFDWRSRHGANDSEKVDYYYDAEEPGTGWLSSVKNQNAYQCDGLCYIYGPIGALEGLINIYFNHHCYYDLSEQQVLDCDTDTSSDQCTEGSPWTTCNYIRDYGVVNDEECYPRIDNPQECPIQECSVIDEEPTYRVYISSYEPISGISEPTIDEIKLAIINHGPLYTTLYHYNGFRGNHIMALIGYNIIREGDVYYKNSTYGADSIIVHEDSPYISQLSWIYKDSQGIGVGENGFRIHSDGRYHPKEVMQINIPIEVLYSNPQNNPYDKDQDGYLNWGLYAEPDLPEDACSHDLSLEDSDDSENRIGPFNENYFGIPVKPEISVEVSVGGLNPTLVEQGDFYFFEADNCTLTVKISNPGTAQLNLSPIPQAVTIDQEYDPLCFRIEGNQPDFEICMNGGYSTFTINFDASDPDLSHIAEVSIHLAESDMDPVFEFALVYNGCGYSTEDHEIRTNTQLAGYHAFQQDIKVCSGYTLEVTGKVAMTENASIFVDQGAQLIINGGTITGSCDKLWKGIDVWGNPYLYQSPANQGLVKIFNGGTVEFADTAIETRKYELPHDFTPSGGIIYCQDAVFKDNIIDVCFHPYQGIYSGLPQPNLSKFERSLFETTDDLSFLEYPSPSLPDKHVILNQVNGIHFRGCHFVNYTDVIDTRGIGIISYEAGYFVEGKCNVPVSPCPDLTPSVFEALNYGIRAFNNTGVYTVSVHDAEFLHNHRGIFMSLVEHPTVIRSNFDLSDPGTFWVSDQNIVGLYMENFTTGFQVEENHFFGEAGQIATVGIHLLNTGPVFNEIYNNSFQNLSSGIIAAGENRDENGNGLCIKCNDFTDNVYDIYISSEEGSEPSRMGIAYLQGDDTPEPDNTLAAGNTFSKYFNVQINYINETDCNPIKYTYHGENLTDLKLIPAPTDPPQPTDHIKLISNDFIQYSKENACPSHLGSGGIIVNEEKLKISTEILTISALKDSMYSLLDGGSTDNLNYTVQTSLPDESLVIRQELLQYSPFLSDTVLISSIHKEDVLPNEIIRDVLVANPQSAKSKNILNTIFTRQDTLPGYMMAEILQGQNVFGDLELMEQQIAKHGSIRDNSLSSLIRIYKSDTSYQSNYSDSILLLLQQQNSLTYYTNSVFYHLEDNDSTGLYCTLNNIPLIFNLTDLELSEYNNLIDLVDILYHSQADSSILDTADIQLLTDISNTPTFLSGIYARNLLIHEGLIEYQEPLCLPKILKSSNTNENLYIYSSAIKKLDIFPNPVRKYFILEYAVEAEITGCQNINLIDISGRVVHYIPLRKKQDQLLIPVINLSSGIYIIQLCDKGQLLGQEKIIICK